MFSRRFDYPLHIGVTEAGTLARAPSGLAVGLGILLSEEDQLTRSG